MANETFLDKVSYREFTLFEIEKFTLYKRYGLLAKPINKDLPDIMEWNFGKVKELQFMMNVAQTTDTVPGLLAFVYDSEKDSFFDMYWYEVLQMYSHILKELERITEREKVLEYEPNADEIQAGLEHVSSFGSFATIDVLAQGDILLYDEIEAKPYYLVFAKLHLESVKARYVERLASIRSKRK